MSLKQKVMQGVKWTTFSTISIVILQLVQLIVLGRLLDSNAYGLMGMVLVIVGIADLFMDMGISNATIQSEKVSKNELSSLYWLNIFCGLFIAVLIWLLIPFFATFFKEDQLNELLIWVVLIFVITPFGQQYKALLQRELKFNLLSKIEIVSTLIGVLVSLLAAYLNYGVMSLIWGLLVIVCIRTILLNIIGLRYYRPNFYFNFKDTKRFLNFGIYQAGESSINYLNSKIDSIIIGRFIGSTALGYYTMAFNIIILPSTKINPIITRVIFPVFSRIQNDTQKLKDNFFKLLTLVSLINFPIFFGLFITAPLLIPTVFGDQWIPSVELVQLLCGVGLLRSIGNPIGSLMMATGNVKLSFKFNAFKMVTQIPGIIIGAYFLGVLGVAYIYLILQVFYTVFSYKYLISKTLGPSLKVYIKTFIPAFIGSVLMVGAVWLFGNILPDIPAVYNLIIQVVIGGLVYVLIVFNFNNSVINELKRLLLRKLRSKNINFN
ncbi:MOP flippase family protein [Metabacillus sp. FJAT-53654]|uniref:MOP flippase family protein n=1 Tax=Metabacillus rhizosphaerae TaxID=3117747 RepID=A0ABZ2MW43_9BACI